MKSVFIVFFIAVLAVGCDHAESTADRQATPPGVDNAARKAVSPRPAATQPAVKKSAPGKAGVKTRPQSSGTVNEPVTPQQPPGSADQDNPMQLPTLETAPPETALETDIVDMTELGDFSITGAKKSRCRTLYAETYDLMLRNRKVDQEVAARFKAAKKQFILDCLDKSDEEIAQLENQLRALELKTHDSVTLSPFGKNKK